ncbi:MAG: MFS transporter [Chloroflexota bacterium]|nr:MFS transporter [Chloroflexota bacterium]
MMSCYDTRLLLSYGARPGTSRKGVPQLGFHLAICPDCRAVWDAILQDSGDETSTRGNVGTDGLSSASAAKTIAFQGKSCALTAADKCDVSSTSFAPTLLEDSRMLDVAPSEAEQPSLAAPSSGEIPAVSAAVNSEVEPVTYRSLLQNSNFRLLWLGQAVSTFGSFFTRVAVPIYVFSLTTSYAHLGFTFFSSLVASLVFGLFAGAFVDRWDRRRTMIGADIANAMVLLGLILTIHLPIPVSVKLYGIYLISFTAGLLREIFNPARIAIFTDVVAEHQLLPANTLDEATITFGELLSYPIAAAALLFVGPSIAFGIDSVSFLISAVLIWRVKVPRSGSPRTTTSNIWREIAEGLTVANSLPLVRKIVFLSLFIPLFISLLNTLQLPYAVEALRSTKEIGYLSLEAAMAVGLIVGMLLLGRWGQALSRTWLLATGITTFGLAIFAQGMLPELAPYLGITLDAAGPWTPLLFLALPFALLSGAANSLILGSIRTMLQESTPRDVLGRVYSVKTVAGGVGFAGGALLTGMGQGQPARVVAVVGAILIVSGLMCRVWLGEKLSLTILFHRHLRM